MKKLLVTSILIFSWLAINAQWLHEQKVQLKWDQNEDGFNFWPESFEGATTSFDSPPKYSFKINIPTDGTLDIDIIDENISIASYNKMFGIEDNWDIASSITQRGSSYFANVTVTPIKKTKTGYYKLLDFTLQIKLISEFSSNSRDPKFKSESVLRSGTFYKIAITETGAYSISGQQLVDNLNININDLDPSKIQLFAGHPSRLPEKVDDERTDDLIEVPLSIQGGGDNNFDNTDEIRFFAYGPNSWTYDSENDFYTHNTNVYSDSNYVFLKIDGSSGLRISQASSPSNPAYSTNDYDYLQIYDEDRVNLLGSYQQTEGTGQVWYSDYFGVDTEQDFASKFDFDGLVTSKNAKVTYEMAARSGATTSSQLVIDGAAIANSYTPTTITNIESAYARIDKGSEEIILSSKPSITISYQKTNPTDEAWLNYIQIESRRQVGIYGGQSIIQDENSIIHNSAQFTSSIPNGTTLWNITEMNNIKNVVHNNGSWAYNTNGKLQKFIAVRDFKTPHLVGQIENQNLHSLQETDMIIIHHKSFKAEAERLATHRSSQNNITVTTVDVDDIYNEFSSGKLDPTAIRDFAKMVHDRTENFKYLLLLGDGSYDYRNRVSGLADHNFVPAYETPESLHPIYGFPSDDFYALLSDSEGSNLQGDLDISVGRIPIETIDQAQNVIDKIEAYEKGINRFGDWRLKITFSADDEDTNTHLSQSDNIATDVRNENPVYNQQKVYFDAFEQVSTPGGDRFYDASNAINNNVQSGQLILNYLGHGGPNGWAQERVLKLSDIDTWNNAEQMPILVTATCSFTGYDDPHIVSAGEYAFRKKNGGCVALYTTVRAVFSNQNKALADGIFDNIFEKDDGQGRTLGEIITSAKNSLASTSENSRKFSLIGDPAMRIAIPTQNIVTTHINDVAVSEENMDTLRALEEVTISGLITDNNGQTINDFNGTIYPTVFDKQSSIETLANDPKSLKRKFDVFKNILFKGSASVVNGEFTFTFILPKDINYKYGLGRISYYADNGVDLDASGFFEDVVIGGSLPETITDDEGPIMELFMNDQNFKNGGITNSNTNLLVFLSDDLGINTSGTSIGHDLTATLDDNEVFVLNDFYKADINSFKSGSVKFPINDLSVGRHTIVVKAWDITNNSTEESIEFEVVESLDGKVINVLAYPNPIDNENQLSIVFEHDLADQRLTAKLFIFNSIGQFVDETSHTIPAGGNRVKLSISDNDGKFYSLPHGMYYYKIKLISNELNTFRESDLEKLVKVR